MALSVGRKIFLGVFTFVNTSKKIVYNVIKFVKFIKFIKFIKLIKLIKLKVES